MAVTQIAYPQLINRSWLLRSDADSSLADIHAAEERSKAHLSAIDSAQREAASARQRISDLASEVSQVKANVDTQAASVLAQHSQVSETAAKVRLTAQQ
jgi:hypothetical protein